MKWWLSVPPAATAKYWAVMVMQHVAPKDWPSALERVPEALRPDAEQFLREAAQRMRVAREAKREVHGPGTER